MSQRNSVSYAAPSVPISVPTDAALAHITPVLWATTGVLGAGALFDLGILWIAQREATPQWEFMAVSNTLNAIPTLILALGIAYLALGVGRVKSSIGYRLVGAWLLAFGLLSGGMGLLLVTDYFLLSGIVAPEGKELLRSTTVKGVLLSGLFFLLLVPTGFLAMIRSKSRA